MIPILIPFKWLVRFRTNAVVSCRSKSVRPHDGQEIYSVLLMRVRDACRIPNAVWFTCSSDPQPSAARKTPSPNPSMSKAPISVAEYNCKFSEVRPPYAFPIITGIWQSSDINSINKRRCSAIPCSL